MKDDKQLIREYKQRGNIAARDQLINKYIPLVRSIAKGFIGRGEPMEDLVQIGTIGLIKAVDRFDPKKGFELSTYAMPNITGEIKRHFRDKTSAVRIPRSLQDLNLKLYRRLDELTAELGRPPTVAERATDAGVAPQEAAQALASSQAYVSLALTNEDDETSILSTLGFDDPEYETSEYRAILHDALDSLSDEERELLHMRFFEGQSQQQIADYLEVSQMRVSRLIRDSLEKLRIALEI